MSSIRKSTRRASRCRMLSICKAPSVVRTADAGGSVAGLGAGGAPEAERRVSPKAAIRLAESRPRNSRLTKQRNARKIRRKGMTPNIQDSVSPAAFPAGEARAKEGLGEVAIAT